MAQSIRRKAYGEKRFDGTFVCDYCGAPYHTTDLIRDTDGLLRCPIDREGDSIRDMEDQIAAAIGNMQPPRRKIRDLL